MVDGMVPVSAESVRESDASLVKDPMSLGMVPVRPESSNQRETVEITVMRNGN
jgi:hypothetical protein